MNGNEDQGRMHGMTRAEWYRLWEDVEWHKQLIQTCYEIGTNEDAHTTHRAEALSIWGNLISVGLAKEFNPDPSGRSYAKVLRDVQMETMKGYRAISESAREAAAERLDAVKFTMSVVVQFIDRKHLGIGNQDGSEGFTLGSSPTGSFGNN